MKTIDKIITAVKVFYPEAEAVFTTEYWSSFEIRVEGKTIAIRAYEEQAWSDALNIIATHAKSEIEQQILDKK